MEMDIRVLSPVGLSNLVLFSILAGLLYVSKLLVLRVRTVKTWAANRNPEKSEGWKPLDFSATQPIRSNFDWTNEDVKPYRPWHDGPYHMTMGEHYRTADIGTWLIFAARHQEDMP
jgi:hypothetical protein